MPWPMRAFITVEREVQRVQREQYYTPVRIDYWLRHWGDLEALAETPGTARGLLHPRSGYTDAPRLGKHQKGPGSDRLRYAAVRADIELAQSQLPHHECLLIEYRKQLLPFSTISRQLKRRKQSTIQDYRSALDSMAQLLGWTATQAA